MLYGLDSLLPRILSNDVRFVALNNSLSYSVRSSLLLFNQLLYGQHWFSRCDNVSLEISKSPRSYRDVTSEPAALFCLLSPMRKCRHAQLALIHLPCFPHLPLVPCVCVCVCRCCVRTDYSYFGVTSIFPSRVCTLPSWGNMISRHNSGRKREVLK